MLPTGAADGGKRGAGVASGTSHGVVLTDGRRVGAAVHTSDTAYWTVAVASISHEHGKFLRFGFPPFDRKHNIQVVMEGPVLYALRADQSMETRIVKAR